MTIQKWLHNHERLVFVILFCLLLAGFLLRVSVMGYGVGSGGNWYYAWLTSLVIDGDIDFSNQAVLHPYLAVGESHFFYERFAEPGVTATGAQGNSTAIGAAIFWIPFFLVAHAIVLFFNLFGVGFSTNGYSVVHQVITLTGSIVYATLGMWISYRTASKFFDRTLSLIATLAILFGFATIQYVMIEPSIAHAITIFTVSCFLGYFYTTRNEHSWKRWLILGFLGGLMLLSRWQEGFFLLVPLVYWLRDFWKYPAQRFMLVSRGLVFAAVIFLVFSPQLVAWKILYGGFFSLPPETGAIMDFVHPLLGTYLFSFQHSLLVTTPIILLALFGIPFLFRKDRFWCFALVITLLLFIYVNSSLQELGGNAFGARRMIDHFFVFTLFLSAFLDRLRTTRWLIPVLIVISALILYNIAYMLEYDLNLVHRRDPVTPMQVLSNIPKIPETILKYAL